MSLRYDDRWIWDFWLAIDGPDVHLFHLQAPRALGDPELRHRHATVGHAVSRDLRTWTELPTALAAGPPGAFDDLATWTGSVMRHGRRWHMLYSGISRAEGGAVQRIGRATSDDLVHWERWRRRPTLGASDVESQGGPLSGRGRMPGCRACESVSSRAGATVPA